MKPANTPAIPSPLKAEDRVVRSVLVALRDRVHRITANLSESDTEITLLQEKAISIENEIEELASQISTSDAVRILELQDDLEALESSINSEVTPYLVPTGAITMWGTGTAPTGWLLCNGGSYSTTTYADLYNKIGYTFGGAGSSFNVPNLTSRFVQGVGGSDSVGDVIGSNDYDLSHVHNTLDLTDAGGSVNTGTPSATTEVQSGTGTTVASDTHTHLGGSHEHNVNIDSSEGIWNDATVESDDTAIDLRPEALVLYYIIKT